MNELGHVSFKKILYGTQKSVYSRSKSLKVIKEPKKIVIVMWKDFFRWRHMNTM